ncbi:MAG: PilZ domain-containing protein, partial [Deltaproteobacteria bacterium]|nr:PilZ domain-containing protein [Deltaproteobacteria bacterium]
GGNRRLFDRKLFENKVIFEDESGDPLLELPMTNLSVGGLYLAGDVPIRQGAKVLLSFKLPSQATPIRVVGEIVRLERTGHGHHLKGLGVRFVEIPPETVSAIQQWACE